MDQPESQIVRDAIRIWYAGMESVRGEKLIKDHVRWNGSTLWVRDQAFDLTDANRIVIIGAGKATQAMCAGLVAVLQEHPGKKLDGWINVPESIDGPGPCYPVQVHHARPRGMNEPTEAAAFGAQRILQMARDCSPTDVVICLLSGGGSALLPLPRPGVRLQDKLAVTKYLSGAGCTIQELNAVRRSLSQIKAGGLARACRASKLITLILSDVLGDPIEFIASGPTELNHPPDPELALRILRQAAPNPVSIPEPVWQTLQRDSAAPKLYSRQTTSQVHNLVLGNNAVAVQAAERTALMLGFDCTSYSSLQAEGDVKQLAKEFVDGMLQRLETPQATCWIHGGEPTVTLPESSIRGRGGRNQQLALCVLRELILRRDPFPEREFLFLSAGTDGEDGPTDAAGAWIDSSLLESCRSKLHVIDDHLERGDAYPFFQQAGRLLVTGETGTNVCDLRITIVR